MERMIGTVSRGVRAPIIREGDDIVKIVTDSILAASNGGKDLRDKDVVAVTEAVVARAQGNYVGVEDIAADVRAKFPSGEFGVVFPILSRNRFAICLRGIAKDIRSGGIDGNRTGIGRRVRRFLSGMERKSLKMITVFWHWNVPFFSDVFIFLSRKKSTFVRIES